MKVGLLHIHIDILYIHIHIDTYILTECIKTGVLFSVAPMLTQLFTGRFIPRTLPHMETHTPGGGGIYMSAPNIMYVYMYVAKTSHHSPCIYGSVDYAGVILEVDKPFQSISRPLKLHLCTVSTKCVAQAVCHLHSLQHTHTH